MKFLKFEVMAKAALICFLLVFSFSCEKEEFIEDSVPLTEEGEDSLEEDYIFREGAVQEHPIYNEENARKVAESSVSLRAYSGFVITGIYLFDFRTEDIFGQPFDKNHNPDPQFRFARSYHDLKKSSKCRKSEKYRNAIPGQTYAFHKKNMPFVMDGMNTPYYLGLFDHDKDRRLKKNADDLMQLYVISPQMIYNAHGSAKIYLHIKGNGYHILIYGYWY